MTDDAIAIWIQPLRIWIRPSEFLTKPQMAEAVRLFKIHGYRAAARIQTYVIDPNMDAITDKLGQRIEPHHLVYAVVYTIANHPDRFTVAEDT